MIFDIKKKKFKKEEKTSKKISIDEEEEEQENNQKETETTKKQILVLDSDDDINGIFCKDSTFKSIGVCEELCEVLDRLNYKYPTKIQKETLPYALEGKDIIGLAETGSGKTFAYGIPIIQKLLDSPNYFFFACILAPTRELCLQINQTFRNFRSWDWLKNLCFSGRIRSNFTSNFFV